MSDYKKHIKGREHKEVGLDRTHFCDYIVPISVVSTFEEFITSTDGSAAAHSACGQAKSMVELTIIPVSCM
ncbi:hypothetical protein MHYP_G00340360 [Metynnis hypsauchen]